MLEKNAGKLFYLRAGGQGVGHGIHQGDHGAVVGAIDLGVSRVGVDLLLSGGDVQRLGHGLIEQSFLGVVFQIALEVGQHGVGALVAQQILDEAVEVCRAEKKSGKILSIGFQPRFDANMQMIKKIVQSGALGEVYYIQTGGGRRRGIPNSTFIEEKTAGIGALGDIGCYSLDMVLNAIGYPKPLTVSGYKSDFFGKSYEYSAPENASRFSVDDFAAAFIRLEGGIILDFRISWAMHMNTPGDTIILGKKAGLRIPSTDCWNGSVGGPMTIYHDVAGVQCQTTIPILSNGDGQFSGLFDRKVRSFLDAILTNGTSPVPTSQILYNQAIIDGICKSANVGHEINIEIPEI